MMKKSEAGEDEPGEAPLHRHPSLGLLGPTCPIPAAARARPLEQCGWLTRLVAARGHHETVTLVERSLIQAIESLIVDRSGRIARWSGDDAAVVRARPLAVTSIDSVAEGVHFEPFLALAADVGWKALATALSDLAAMGADAGEAYVALALPEGFEEPWSSCGGMEELAERCGATIAGGDVIRGAGADRDRERHRLGGHRGGARGARRRASRATWSASPATLGGSEAGRAAARARRERARRAACAATCAPSRGSTPAAAWPRRGRQAMIDLSDGAGHRRRSRGRAQRRGAAVRLADLPLAPGVGAGRTRPGASGGRRGRRLRAAGHRARSRQRAAEAAASAAGAP